MMAPVPTWSARPTVIQGLFSAGRPRIPAMASPPAPIQPRMASPQPVQPRAEQRQSVPPRPGVPQAVQRVGNGKAFQLPASLSNLRGVGGQPLPVPVRQKMESFFGTSFADVRVHVGCQAPSIGALAFTHGSDLYFAPGQYNPNTTQGQQLLGHELTHVVQQRSGRVRNPFGSGIAVVQDRDMEAEADRMGVRAAAASWPVQTKLAAINRHGTGSRYPGYPKVILRRVDPDFVTFRGPGAGPVTKIEMQEFYDRFVLSEVERLSIKPIEDSLLQDMKHANLMFTVFMLNSRDLNAIEVKLNDLIVAVNAAADDYDGTINAQPGAQGSEAAFRNERMRREGAKHHVGITKEMPLRGVQSRAEGEQLLITLRNALNGALGAGYPLGSVGVRGSAVTGIRSRNQQPFEQGTGAHQAVSDASDLDFFFTCPNLERQIKATQNNLPANRRLNAGGTMNAQYLDRWLNLGQNTNGYANSVALAAALTAFSNAAQGQTGRKCDVTFIGNPTAGQLAADPGTLIL